MILTLLIASAIYAAQLWRYGSHVTPDGAYYMAMGRGHSVPAPYAYRLLPRYIGTLAGWRVVHVVSYLALIAAAYVAVHAQAPSVAMPAALTLAALPSVRMSISWPVLTDMPSWAVVGTSLALAHYDPVTAVCVALLGIVVTEKTPWFAVATIAPLIDWHVAVIALCWLVSASVLLWWSTKTAVADRDWLQHPFREAIARHRTSNITNWLLPWGGAVVALPFLNYSTWLVVLLSYGQCLIAQDRARLYMMAAPVVITSLATFDTLTVFAVAVITYFIPQTEV